MSWLQYLGFDQRLAQLGTLAYALASPAIVYSQKFMGHQAAAWMIGIALAAAWFGRRGDERWRVTAGFLGALAAITEYPTAPMLGGVVLLTTLGAQHRRRGLVSFIGGATPASGWRPPSITHTPLARPGKPATRSSPMRAFGRFINTVYSALAGRVSVLIGLSLSHQRGLLLLAPWLVGASLLSPLFLRQQRWRLLDTRAQLAHVGLQLWIAAGFSYWLGRWSVGPPHSQRPAFAGSVGDSRLASTA
ncbi:MAG: hypothetical protein R3C68_03590 [Myxococcota bacterium]